MEKIAPRKNVSADPSICAASAQPTRASAPKPVRKTPASRPSERPFNIRAQPARAAARGVRETTTTAAPARTAAIASATHINARSATTGSTPSAAAARKIACGVAPGAPANTAKS